MIVFGAQHFMYASFIAFLIPAWIPGHLFWAYFTGTAFIAAGLSIAAKISARRSPPRVSASCSCSGCSFFTRRASSVNLAMVMNGAAYLWPWPWLAAPLSWPPLLKE